MANKGALVIPKCFILLSVVVNLSITVFCSAPCAEEAQEIVQRCFDYMRGKASVAQVDMTIHRPDWERTVTIKAWTRGEKESLFTILAPSKDEGELNA